MNGEHASHLSKEKLQRHHDGELNEQEAADVRQHLRTCAACQAELDSLERLSDMVRWSTDDTAAASEQSDEAFTRMFAEIERAVSQEDALRTSQPNVIPLSQKRAASPFTRAMPALGALALAAAAFLVLNRSDTLPRDGGEEQLALLDAAQHSEVTAVKFGRNAGQVFGIPLADGRSVPVVWIDDEDEDEEE
ncbi:MAG TPA: zf-HC2 domain-containing protein [Polyangiales bacterium]|nr:zf-HC2 domain-containing protein [Polyangiales bacterium]